MTTDKEIVPVHEWTNGGTRALMLRFVDAGHRSYNNFQWPKEIGAEVTAPDWNPAAVCGGGFHGWPWGVGMGSGKTPVFVDVHWQVVSYDPKDAVWIEDSKVKIRTGKLEYVGSWWGALAKVEAGRTAWIQQAASGAASATGWRGAASATGWRGAASATGERGAASATGERGAASATGASGAASATGGSGAASATGESGAASATGGSGAASATGWRGAASATGERGAASATGASGAASATGARGAASATGERGAASATGARGAASATGERGAASVTNEYCTVECGPTGIASAIADNVTWIVRPGAVFVVRWFGNGGGVRYFKAKDTAKAGEKITFEYGKIIKRVKHAD